MIELKAKKNVSKTKCCISGITCLCSFFPSLWLVRNSHRCLWVRYNYIKGRGGAALFLIKPLWGQRSKINYGCEAILLKLLGLILIFIIFFFNPLDKSSTVLNSGKCSTMWENALFKTGLKFFYITDRKCGAFSLK